MLAGAIALGAVPFTLAGAGSAPRPDAPRERARGSEGRWQFVLSLSLLVPSLQVFSINTLSQLMWVFYPLYGLSVGLSLSVIGLHRGSYSTTSMITRPFIGRMTTWLSYGQLATYALVATAVLSMLVPLFTTFLPLLILHVILGALRAGALVGSMVAAVEYAGSDPRKRGMAAGMYSLGSDSANVFGPLVGGVIADRMGLEATYWALPLVLMVVYFALLAASRVAARRGDEAAV